MKTPTIVPVGGGALRPAVRPLPTLRKNLFLWLHAPLYPPTV